MQCLAVVVVVNVVFVVLAELSGKISNWALKMALAISSVINDATSGVTQNAWSAIPYSATIESTMKNMPRSFATGVARTGIQTGKIAGYRAIGMSAKAVSKVAGSDNKVGMTASNLSTKMNISAKKVSSSKDNNFIQNKILSGFNATTKFAGDSLSKVVAAPVTVTRDAINSESANDFVKKQSEDAGNFITGGLFKKDDTGRTQIGRYFKNNVSDKFKVDGGIKNAIKHRKAEFAARAYHSLNPLKSSSFSQRK